MKMSWRPYKNGAEIGSKGTEDGTVIRDDEYTGGARIPLEKDGWTPFAITCGIYGWMVHTNFASEESEVNTRYDDMKTELSRIVDAIPLKDDPDLDEKAGIVSDMIEAFVEKYW